MQTRDVPVLTGASRTNNGLDHIFDILAAFMFTGVLSTILIPETKLRSLEELSNEDQRGFVRLRPVNAHDVA